MFENKIINALNADKNTYHLPELPLITVYDDNLFVRNDYDILSVGQRNYILNQFKGFGFKQKSGKLATDGKINIHFPKPQRVLALSAYQADFNLTPDQDYYAVTPSTFAEAIFYEGLELGMDWTVEQLKNLINTCPYNIELIRDINYRTPIESVTIKTFQQLLDYQKEVIKEKFKFKKTL